MATNYSGKIKHCGTCSYWGGPRTLNHNGTVRINNLSDSGLCGHLRSIRKNQDAKASQYCNVWEKWGPVKD